MYAAYASPYWSRHACSSAMIRKWPSTIDPTAEITAVHGPTAMQIPNSRTINATHCGFRDIRYNPRVAGSSIGVFR
jgi:hypothetical protein